MLGREFFSPEFERKGSSAMFIVHVMRFWGSARALRATVEHRDSAGPNFWTTLVQIHATCASDLNAASAGTPLDTLRWRMNIDTDDEESGVEFRTAVQWE